MDADPSKAFAKPVSETEAGEVVDMSPNNTHRVNLQGVRLYDAWFSAVSSFTERSSLMNSRGT